MDEEISLKYKLEETEKAILPASLAGLSLGVLLGAVVGEYKGNTKKEARVNYWESQHIRSERNTWDILDYQVKFFEWEQSGQEGKPIKIRSYQSPLRLD